MFKLPKTLAVAVAFTLIGASAVRAQQKEEPVVNIQALASIQDQPVPAPDAGMMISLNVREGQFVTKGMELARVDDREIKADLKVKQAEYDIAKQKGDSILAIQAAEADEKVKLSAYRKAEDSNRRTPNVVPMLEVEKLKYEWELAGLKVLQAKDDQVNAQLTALGKLAAVEAAKVALDRRILRASFDGYVVLITKHVGEWMSPGDPVMRLVRIDKLSVRSQINALKWSPSEIEKKPVTVEVDMPHGKTIKVQGKIAYVSPVVFDNKFDVWAEFDTPMENDRPVVRPGLGGRVTIHVNQNEATTQRLSDAGAGGPAARPAGGSSLPSALPPSFPGK